MPTPGVACGLIAAAPGRGGWRGLREGGSGGEQRGTGESKPTVCRSRFMPFSPMTIIPAAVDGLPKFIIFDIAACPRRSFPFYAAVLDSIKSTRNISWQCVPHMLSSAICQIPMDFISCCRWISPD